MNKLLAALVALGFAGLAGAAQAATLDGETVKIDWLFPNDALVFESSGNVVVGPGVEYNFLDTLDIDISGSTVIITAVQGNGFTNFAFNGIRITDILGTIADFVGFSIMTSTFNNVVATFDANNLFVNFGASGWFSFGDFITLEIAFADAEIPIPAALPLFLTALGGLAFAARRRRKAA